MKIKVMALICTVVLLVTMLACCGTAEQETVAETTVETTVAEETTVETTAETEPPEPATAFEAEGLTLWEEPFVPENFGCYIDGSESQRAAEATTSSAEGIGMTFYSKENQRSNKVITSEIVESDLTVNILELQPEHFDAYKEVIREFYWADRKAKKNTVTMEEWLSVHDEYKLVVFSMNQTGYTAQSMVNAVCKNAGFWGMVLHLPSVVDMKSGDMISITSENQGEVGIFTIQNEEVESDMLIQGRYDRYWLESPDPLSKDVYFWAEYYVMIPNTYDHIAFQHQGRLIALTAEEIEKSNQENDEKEPWEISSILDEDENDWKTREYYFAHIPVKPELLW